MGKREVSIGQSYCKVGATYLSRPAPPWRVQGIFTSFDGLQYAKLINQHDDTLTKTLSLEALCDPRMFSLAQTG